MLGKLLLLLKWHGVGFTLILFFLFPSGVASLLTTSEACIVDAPEEKTPPPGMGAGGGMGGMGGMF